MTFAKTFIMKSGLQRPFPLVRVDVVSFTLNSADFKSEHRG